MRQKLKPTIICEILLLYLLVISCQGKKEIGAKIPPNIQTITLSDIIKDPYYYDGKEVIIKGVVASQCMSLCDFVLTDGTNRVTIFPQGFKLPKLEKGKEVKVYAKIIKGSEQVIFSALGISF